MSTDAFPAIDDASFDAQVLARAGVSVIDFWSASCIPCKQMTRLLQQVAVEIPADVLIGQVDADHNPALVERYGVRSLPTLLLFKDGALKETRTGIDRKQVIKKAIESL
jgi:thioredoxin 1